MEIGVFLMGILAGFVMVFLIMISITVIRIEKKITNACDLTEMRVSKLYKGGFQ